MEAVVLSEEPREKSRLGAEGSRRCMCASLLHQGVLPRRFRENALLSHGRGYCTGILRLRARELCCLKIFWWRFAQDNKSYLGVGCGTAPGTAAVALTTNLAGKISKRGREPSFSRKR